MPLQVVLRNLILSNQLMMGTSGAEMAEKQKLVDQLKYVIVTLAAFPLVIVYPFVQKYFAKALWSALSRADPLHWFTGPQLVCVCPVCGLLI